MPPDHRLRLHDDDRIGPSCPHAPQHDPERPVHQPDPRPALLQHGGELLTQGEVLDHEAALRPEPRDECSDGRQEEPNHGGREAAGAGRNVNNSQRNGILASHRGIGAEIARSLASEGADLVIASLIHDEVEQIAEEVRGMGRAALGVLTDVTVKSDVVRMVDRAIERYERIDVLVNNAGTIRPAGFLEASEEDWDALQAVDLKGVFLCTQAVAAHMIRQRAGKIVNISSMASFGWYMPGYASYCAAKAAVNNLTKYTARELGEFGINVNAVAPGEILTALTYQGQTKEEVDKKLASSRAMTMVKRIGEPRDVAALVLFLASDEASFITGEIVSIDGGRIDRM